MDKDNLEVVVRPRAVIEAEVDENTFKLQMYDSRMNSLRDAIDPLSEDQKTALDSFGARCYEHRLSDEEVKAAVPSEILSISLWYRDAVEEAKVLYHVQDKLDQEMLPYLKEDLKHLCADISARVDYDAFFDYHRKQDGNSLMASAEDLYQLRRFQYELANNTSIRDGEKEKVDYGFYSYRIHTLQTFEKQWQEAGFLRAEALPDYKMSQDFGPNVARDRIELVRVLGEFLTQLQSFNQVSRIYKNSLVVRWPFDFALSAVHRALDVGEDKYYLREGFSQVDYDPEFVAAAKRHVLKVVEEHQKQGHLIPTAEVLEEERRRIDNLGEVDANDLVFGGFEAPDGMITAVTPEDVLIELKQILPPDFIHGLKTFTRKDGPNKKILADGIDAEVMGTFFPRFDEGGNCIAADIESYVNPFVPENASYQDKALAKARFMETVWHEFGHNAHHMMRADEMFKWEDVIARDATMVSWYVKYSHTLDVNRGKREDFAESFRLFLSNPAVLSLLSPDRFKFMLDYFFNRLKSDQRPVFNLIMLSKILASQQGWNDLGYSTDKVRQAYLGQEEDNS